MATTAVSVRWVCSYRGEATYEAWVAGSRERFRLRWMADPYDPKVWNMTEEQYEREIVGAVGLVAKSNDCGVFPPVDVAQEIRRMSEANDISVRGMGRINGPAWVWEVADIPR